MAEQKFNFLPGVPVTVLLYLSLSGLLSSALDT